MFLLDTNIISDLIRNPAGRTARRLAAVGDDKVATSVVVAGELRYGAAKKGSTKLSDRVEAILAEVEVQPVTREAAELYGTIRADLERQGLPIGQNDLWIAAHAMATKAILVTANVGKFDRVEGLDVQNWLEAAR